MSSKVSNRRLRRAAQTKPKTPLTAISKTISENIDTIGKTVTVATTSGIMLTVGLPGQALADTQTVNISHGEEFSVQALPQKSDNLGAVFSHIDEKIGGFENKQPQFDFTRSQISVFEKEIIPEPEPESEVVVSGSANSVVPPAASKLSANSAVDVKAFASTTNSTAAAVIAKAKEGVGVPYVSGGANLAGWDCSGYVSWVYAEALGITLPRTSQAMNTMVGAVKTVSPEPGDLVIMRGGGHVAIYAGNNSIYEASVPGKPTALNQIWDNSATFISMKSIIAKK